MKIIIITKTKRITLKIITLNKIYAALIATSTFTMMPHSKIKIKVHH